MNLRILFSFSSASKAIKNHIKDIMINPDISKDMREEADYLHMYRFTDVFMLLCILWKEWNRKEVQALSDILSS